MNLLVTGGAGYIGSITTELLIRHGHRVTVLDNLSRGHRESVPTAATLEVADLLDFKRVSDVFARCRPDAVLHFASHSQVGESMREPWLYLGENVAAGINAMRAAVECGTKRFILSSTANIFDMSGENPVAEEAQVCPGSPYGEAKLTLERALGWFKKTHGLESVCLRYFNAAGATEEIGGDHDPETHLIPLVLRVAQGRLRVVQIFGRDYSTRDGTCVRDYIHVADLAEAHRLALEAGGPAYNLGNGRGFSVLDIIEVARRVTGHPIPTVDAPRRPGDPAFLVADSSKIRRELGWVPKISAIEEIIRSAWRWMQRYPHGYRGR